MRRDKQCVHKIFGEDISINAGDFMFFAPLRVLMDSRKFDDKVKLDIMRVYSEEMITIHIGQGLDLYWHNVKNVRSRIPSEKNYLQMVAHKTGVLARLSAKLTGIVLGLDARTIDKLGVFTESLGVAFQIKDDVLNLASGEYCKGKGMAGEDIYEGKISLIVIHCLQHASEKDRERLLDILQMRTKDEVLIAEAIQIVQKTDSLEYSMKKAEEILMQAWNEIEILLLDNLAKQKLRLLAEYVLARNTQSENRTHKV
eukprot:TRINITY_DN393_c0_g1_i1.p3 TRINITY_DN393_c0_g1~~TRINITY_DN393_c0_g1_i1.p3  ORF type:complete len:256 (-),score=83.27 TRINITY_DN393_c0_g1_i1:328-1095(-)